MRARTLGLVGGLDGLINRRMGCSAVGMEWVGIRVLARIYEILAASLARRQPHKGNVQSISFALVRPCGRGAARAKLCGWSPLTPPSRFTFRVWLRASLSLRPRSQTPCRPPSRANSNRRRSIELQPLDVLLVLSSGQQLRGVIRISKRNRNQPPLTIRVPVDLFRRIDQRFIGLDHFSGEWHI